MAQDRVQILSGEANSKLSNLWQPYLQKPFHHLPILPGLFMSPRCQRLLFQAQMLKAYRDDSDQIRH